MTLSRWTLYPNGTRGSSRRWLNPYSIPYSIGMSPRAGFCPSVFPDSWQILRHQSRFWIPHEMYPFLEWKCKLHILEKRSMKMYILIFAFLLLGFRHGWMPKATDGCIACSLLWLLNKLSRSKSQITRASLIYFKAAIQIGFEKSNFLSPSYGHFLKKVRFLA